MKWLIRFVISLLLLGSGSSGQAEEVDQDQQAREQRLAQYLTGAKFVGRYTTDGDQQEATQPETYTINKAEKLAERNRFRLTTRIQYGGKDVEVPIDLNILWSGNTPVITLDNVGIPGMGTFSARVLIHNGRYSGTWSHDEKGGHLFGHVTQE